MAILQLNLEGTCRSDKKVKPPKRLEKQLQAQTIATLANLGYAALEVGATRPRVTCRNCKTSFTPTGWMGNAVGFPDLAVIRYSPAFPPVAALIELKGDGTKVRDEQQRLADAGRSIIAYSIEDAVRAMVATETALDSYRYPAERREQHQRFLELNKGRLG